MTKGQVLYASFWSVLSEACVAGIGLASFFAYAAFLSPADFGIVAFCAGLTNLLTFIVDNSLRLAVVRDQSSDPVVLDVAFRGNIILGAVGYIFVAAASVPAAAILHDERVVVVLPLLALQIPCSALSTTHLAAAQRRFEFRTLFKIRLLSTLGSLAVGIAMACANLAYWSLVGASLANGIIQLIAAWRIIAWRPASNFSWTVASPLYRFAGWISLDMAIAWAVSWSGGFMLGCFRGEHELGFYRLSEQAAGAVIGTAVDPLNPVFYTAYSKSLPIRFELDDLCYQFGRVVAFLAAPLTSILALAAGSIESILGGRWRGLAALIVFSALIRLAFSVAMPLVPYLRAKGYSKIVALLRLILILCQTPIFLLTAPMGVKALLISTLSLETVLYFVYFFAAWMATGVPVIKLIGQQALIVGMTGCGALLGFLLAVQIGGNQFERLSISIAFFAVWFATFIFIMERELVAEVLRSRTFSALLRSKH